MPTLHNRRGLGLLIWPDGEITVFESYAEARDFYNGVATGVALMEIFND